MKPAARSPSSVAYHARPAEVNALRAAAIVTIGSALASIGFSLWAWYFAMSTYGPAAVRRWTGPWLVAAPLLGAAGIGCLLRLWRLTRLWVEVFPEGLLVHRGRWTDRIAWGDIREIRTWPAHRPGAAFAALEIRLSGGRTLRLTRALADLEGLVQHVKRRAYPLLQERYRIRFNRGETLVFGPLRLAPEGVQVGKKAIQWGSIRAVEIQGGRLTITAAEAPGSRLRLAAARVPNVDLCVQIIRLLGQVP